MVEATPPEWRDTCEHCGCPFECGQPRWLEQRSHFVHTECARWELWETPPYVWKLGELRKRYRDCTGEEREKVAQAGRSIRQMERAWPVDAACRVSRVLEVVRLVG